MIFFAVHQTEHLNCLWRHLLLALHTLEGPDYSFFRSSSVPCFSADRSPLRCLDTFLTHELPTRLHTHIPYRSQSPHTRTDCSRCIDLHVHRLRPRELIVA